MARNSSASPAAVPADSAGRPETVSLPQAMWQGVKLRFTSGQLGVLPIVIGLALIWTYFQLQNEHFLTARNLSNLVLQISVSGTIAVGAVLFLLLGEIDLSVGSVAGATSAVLGVLIVDVGWPWWAGILGMLAAGALIGLIQGFWIAVLRVPSFVVSLAGLLIWLGVQLHVLGDAGTLNVFDPHITAIASTFLPAAWGWALGIVALIGYAGTHFMQDMSRRRAGMQAARPAVLVLQTAVIAVLLLGAVAILNRANGVPTAGVLFFSLVAFFAWLTRRTSFGRKVYAVGGHAEAARRAGINVARIRITVFMLSSTLAAAGGLILTSRLQAASTQSGGGTLLLEVIAAAVIGGTSLFGGRGNVWGALLGALVIGSVSNGLDLVGQSADVKYMVEGAILLLAVTLDAFSRRRLAATGR